MESYWHGYERWGNGGKLGKLIFLAVRDALNAPAHPDSKRTARRKQRDLIRYGERRLKESQGTAVACPVQRTRKRREVRAMRARLREEQKQFALLFAARLQGRRGRYGN